jgi:hypothetical protein
MKTLTLAAVVLSGGLASGCLSDTGDSYHRWQGGPDNRQWDASKSYDGRSHHDRQLSREDYVHRGSDGRYYCRRSDGSTGLVVGALGGAALGGIIGGDALGALVGAAGGAVLGTSIDRGQVHCR